MSNRNFPQLRGLGWPVNKKPYFSTIQSKSVGGQEVRIPNYPYPLEEFELPINHLHANSQLAPNLADFQQLWAFYVAGLGPWDSFLYWDQTDNFTVTNALYESLGTIGGLPAGYGWNVIGTGDGVTTAFQLYRNLGGALQPVFAVNGITASLNPPITSPFVKVYDNNSPVIGGWTVSAAGMLTFSSPPAAGHSIAADFGYFKRCVFADDNLSFENFMSSLLRVKSVRLRQVYA
jgi:hypothetical protein